MTETINIAEYVAQGRRLSDEIRGESTWEEMAEAAGLENPAEFLAMFCSDTIDAIVESALRNLPPITAGVPTLCALIIGMRIGRMQATQAFEDLQGQDGISGLEDRG